MTFGESIKTCLFEKYATFSGTAPRSEYWWFILFTFLSFVPFVALEVASSDPTPWLLLQFVWGVLILLPQIAVGARRLHDIPVRLVAASGSCPLARGSHPPRHALPADKVEGQLKP